VGQVPPFDLSLVRGKHLMTHALGNACLSCAVETGMWMLYCVWRVLHARSLQPRAMLVQTPSTSSRDSLQYSLNRLEQKLYLHVLQ
jgi:hypothetical protein